MKRNVLYPIWGLLYIICVCLGAITERNGAVDVLLTIISIGFFLPGAMLLYGAVRTGDTKTMKTLRLISALSLGLTLLALVGNIMTVMSAQVWGDVMYVVLIFVSAPMLCCKYWALSLLLWAMLLFASFPRIWKK